MTANHKVTALLPAYEASEFVQATLDSLSKQESDDFRVIVSVDVCDDGTFEVCREHARADQRFTVHRQTERQGYVGNCNFLLNTANSEYVFFAFHDDILLPLFIKMLARTLDKHPDAIMAFSDMTVKPVEKPEQTWVFTDLEGVTDPLVRAYKILNGAKGWWVPNRGMFRLHESRQIGGLKRHGAGEFSADLPWLFHMSLLGHFVRVPKVLCKKYYMPNSLSRTWEFSADQKFEANVACLRELWNSPLDSRQKMRLAAPLTRALEQATSAQYAKRN